MNLSLHSTSGLLEFFGIFEFLLLIHVLLTLLLQEKFKPAQKLLKIPKTLMKG